MRRLSTKPVAMPGRLYSGPLPEASSGYAYMSGYVATSDALGGPAMNARSAVFVASIVLAAVSEVTTMLMLTDGSTVCVAYESKQIERHVSAC